jgi:SAM-dependent methyltransferase
MYDRTAHLYDLVYERGVGLDYDASTELIVGLAPGATSLLDVACGTGQHLARLRDRFRCEGVDLDDGMLAVARERCPGVPVHRADMCDFDLGRTFDVVTCMFSSIAYVRTEARLRDAIACMAHHLQPGGVLVVEPWLTPEQIIPGHVGVVTAEDDGVKVVRMSQIEVDGQLGDIVMHYLIGTAAGLEHAVERHQVCQFTWEQYEAAFAAAGLVTTVQRDGGPMGRGLIAGRAPAA